MDGVEGIGERTPSADRLSDHTGATLRRVPRFKVQLKDRQEGKRSRGGGEVGCGPILTALRWRLDAA